MRYACETTLAEHASIILFDDHGQGEKNHFLRRGIYE